MVWCDVCENQKLKNSCMNCVGMVGSIDAPSEFKAGRKLYSMLEHIGSKSDSDTVNTYDQSEMEDARILDFLKPGSSVLVVNTDDALDIGIVSEDAANIQTHCGESLEFSQYGDSWFIPYKKPSKFSRYALYYDVNSSCLYEYIGKPSRDMLLFDVHTSGEGSKLTLLTSDVFNNLKPITQYVLKAFSHDSVEYKLTLLSSNQRFIVQHLISTTAEICVLTYPTQAVLHLPREGDGTEWLLEAISYPPTDEYYLPSKYVPDMMTQLLRSCSSAEVLLYFRGERRIGTLIWCSDNKKSFMFMFKCDGIQRLLIDDYGKSWHIILSIQEGFKVGRLYVSESLGPLSDWFEYVGNVGGIRWVLDIRNNNSIIPISAPLVNELRELTVDYVSKYNFKLLTQPTTNGIMLNPNSDSEADVEVIHDVIAIAETDYFMYYVNRTGDRLIIQRKCDKDFAWKIV